MFRVVIAAGPDRGSSLLLRHGRYSVGKAPDCDLVLSDPAVSRRHLTLKVLADGVAVLDIGSKNGSYFQGARFRELILGVGAVLTIGSSQLVLADAGRRSTDPPASDAHRFGKLLGGSLVMRRLFALLERVAESEGPVLIEGETGTGKEICAESLHAAGPRASGPFVVCDLSAVPPPHLESELFGHLRGAFAGADRDQEGAFASADGGTLFIDEIGELSLEAQPRLLRALERREVKPLGATRYVPFDVRVIAATNRDLWEECKAHRFRADLYHRLAVLRVHIPPLRDRSEDIPLLARHILGVGAASLGSDALALLASHDWPGNVRELRNVLTQAVSIAPPGRPICAAELGLVHRTQADPAVGEEWAEGSDFHGAKRHVISSWEKSFLVELMQRAEGNVARAARQAGIDRPYLYRLLRKHGLGPLEDGT
ncbi:MAG TPA: sigma 54-dependent Fis family transcriptional regulator [Kofleriaceae bacterium]|jgi:DNA-binding NtrC family response regulator